MGALRERNAQLEGKLALETQRRDEERKELEAWASRMFEKRCQELHGTYVGGGLVCDLHGSFLKYEPPYPPSGTPPP